MFEQPSCLSEAEEASGPDHHPAVQSGEGEDQTGPGRGRRSVGRGETEFIN